MVERIPIVTKSRMYWSEAEQKHVRVPYDVIACPKEEKDVTGRICKKCEHCRIYLQDVVKCTYKQDLYNMTHQYNHSI